MRSRAFSFFTAWLIVAHVVVACAETQSVDASPSKEFFTSRGIPDPSKEWEAHEYFAALKLLEEFPSSELPRAGAPGASGLLFARLLASRRGAPQDLVQEHVGRSIVRLYAKANASTADYWKELLEAWRQEMSIVVEPALRYAEIEASRRDAALLFEMQPGPSDPRVLAEKMKSYDDYYHDLSMRLKQVVESTIRLGASPELTAGGRAHFVAVMRDSLPGVRERLSPDDRAWLVNLLKALGRLPANAEIAGEIDDLVALIA